MIFRTHAWQSLRHSFPIRKSEWAMGFATIAIWVVLALNTKLFDESVYRPLAAIASQGAWAWACFGVGVGRVCALFINGTHYRSPHARAAFAFLTCYLWFQLTVGLSENAGLGMVFAGFFFIIDALNFRQALIEAAASEGLRNVERNILSRHSR